MCYVYQNTKSHAAPRSADSSLLKEIYYTSASQDWALKSDS